MKLFVGGLISLFVFVAVPSEVGAAMVGVSAEGSLTINVLSYETENGERESVEVKRLVEGKIPIGEKINLSSNDAGEAKLLVSRNGESYEADVTDFSGDIIEVEERIAPKTVRVTHKDGEFLIQQSGYTAKTQYPINIDATTKEFSVRTENGSTFLVVMPYEAVTDLFRAGILSNVSDGVEVELKMNGGGGLSYVARGERKIKLFKVLEVDAPVVAAVSVTTGELSVIEQPLWLSVFGYFLT
jgi:hypothetical protein